MDCVGMSCLNATFTKPISSGTLALSSSKHYWDYLKTEFSDHFLAKGSFLQSELAISILQGNLHISEFLGNVTIIIDNLCCNR